MFDLGPPPKSLFAKPAIILPRPAEVIRPGDPRFAVLNLTAAMFALTALSGFGAGGPSSTGVVEDGGTPSGAQDFTTGFTVFDRSWAVNNGETVFYFRTYANAARTGTFKLAERTGAGAYTIVVSQAFSHGGSGWQQFAITSPYTVPGSGTFHAGMYGASTQSCLTIASRAYKAGDQGLGAQTGFTEDSSDNGFAVGVVY